MQTLQYNRKQQATYSFLEVATIKFLKNGNLFSNSTDFNSDHMSITLFFCFGILLITCFLLVPYLASWGNHEARHWFTFQSLLPFCLSIASIFCFITLPPITECKKWYSEIKILYTTHFCSITTRLTAIAR